MSQTAPPERDTPSAEGRPGGHSTLPTPDRDWKASVAAVTSTITDAAVDAVTIVGDAARTLSGRARDGEQASDTASNGHSGNGHTGAARQRRAGARAAAFANRLTRRDPGHNDTPAPLVDVTPPTDPMPPRTEPLADTAYPTAHVDPEVTQPLVQASTDTSQPLAQVPTSATAPQPSDRASTGHGSTNGRVSTATSATNGTVPLPDTTSTPAAPPLWAFREGTDVRETAWMPSLRQRPERARSWVLRGVALALSAVAGLAAIAVISFALLPRAFALAADSADAELVLPADTEFDPLASRSRVLYSDGSLLAILHGEQDRNPVSIDKMPDHAWQAIISAEDRKFREHDGYDPNGIGRALVRNFRAGSVQEGGSTITQQVARMNFKEVGADESIQRKLKEIIYAVALERRFSKDEILDRYVNQVYFGAGAYGLQAASEEFFDTNVKDITPDQAALLAALISSPSAYNPRENPEAAEQQRDFVLAGMARDGFLTEQEAADYMDEPIEIAKPSDGTNKQPSIVEAVIAEFSSNPLFGATRVERQDALFNGGLRITTTIDPKLQKLAQKTVDANFDDQGPTAAIASVNPKTGAILAASSSKKNNRKNFSLALQGRRQPGSAFKPFVMAAALREGFSPNTTLDARSPLVIPQPFKDWTVQNYGGASYGPMDMRTATMKSVNTYYAQLIELVGVDESVEMAEDLGVSPDAFGKEGAFPSIVLGGLGQGTTPLEMASAYATFANNGVHVQPYLLDEVKRGKDVLLEREPSKKRVLDPGVNAVALDIMKGPVSSGGTAPMYFPDFPVIGKTGTTQTASDAWFVGATPVMSTAVWVGHPKAQIKMYGATGGGTAAPIWRAYMTKALEDRKPKDFPEADEAEFVGKTISVPKVTGKSEQEAMSRLAKAKLIGRVQYQPHATVPAGVVIWASPSDEAQKGTTVYLGVSSGAPPPPPPEPRPEPRDDNDSSDSRSGGNDSTNNDDGNGGSNNDDGNGGGNNGNGNGGGNDG